MLLHTSPAPLLPPVPLLAHTQPNATERFKGVKEAYEVLSDPQQRAAYNRQRAVQVGVVA